MQRQFTSGSRQAPDPFDQFLEEHQYYRKHTARDASCLFRVISEQMYDTQLHHLVIREKCVTYMRKHRKHFDYHVNRDFDDYLDDMSKPKTYGTLLELLAASYMFERNVFLFQPFNLGNYFDEYRSNFVKVFRVFYTPERHFDSVFTSEYIQEAAICQSICYEILYKDLFKLPDVTFAVEQMLHGPTFENMDHRTENNDDGYSTRVHLSDGRSFELDLPINTSCILENYKLCHFHYSNFPRYSDDLQRELKTANNSEEYEKNSLIIQRTAESFLPNKYVSCVRQLLLEGITPFPYKVAKALDPNMYRNIEFDSWNEMRKEMKLQNWYNGDANFKVGAKCHVKLRKSEQDLYTCHIQEIAVDKGQCIVFVEQLGEKRLVPYENLTPLPPDQFKPWTMPYRLQRHMQKYSSVRFTRQYNYRFKFNTTTEHHHEFACESAMDSSESCSNNNYIDDDPKKFARQQQNQHHCTAAASYFKLKQYTHLEDFRAHVEYCTMPLTVSHSNRDVDGSKTASGQSRIVDGSEISRTPSRSSSSAVMLRNNVDGMQNKGSSNTGLNNAEDHLGAPHVIAVPHIEGYDMDNYNPNGPFYVPDMQGFYPMYPYSTAAGVTEDYYGYCGYDGGVPTGAAFMPSINNINGFYYVYNNPPTNYINSANPYFVPAPPPVPQTVAVAQTSPMLVSANTPANPPSFYTQPTFNSAASSRHSNQSLAPLSSNLQSSSAARFPSRSVPNTPTKTTSIGRINYDAKKSLKSNGIDLPTDVATLRFFFNMGLDYYQKQKSNAAEAEPKNELEKDFNDLQIVQIDENSNLVSGPKLDANNNNRSAAPTDDPLHANDTNSTSNPINKQNQSNVNSSNGGGLGNKNNNNNHRRYNSRYFSGKDRQMSQRNNSNQNFHQNSTQQHHQQNYAQHNQRSYNNNNNNNKYSNNNYNASHIQNSTRNTQQQQHNNQQQHLQPVQHANSQHISHASAVEPSCQVSPNIGFDDTSNGANSAEPRNCHTPMMTNNSNIAVVFSNNSDQMIDGMNSGAANTGQLAVSMQSNAGVYIPIPMTTGPPPTSPYGIYAGHATAAIPHHTPGNVGMHPNYMTAPTPQIITHCGLPLPPQQQHQQCTLNSAPGLDLMENVCNSENSNINGALIAMPSPGMPMQCTTYPPPPMPFYFPAGGINPVGGSGAGGISGPFSHQVIPSTPSSNQTGISSAHPSQGYYCLQAPPLLPIPNQQQVTPQMVQQPTAMAANKTSASSSSPQDVNNGPRNNDLVQQNNDLTNA